MVIIRIKFRDEIAKKDKAKKKKKMGERLHRGKQLFAWVPLLFYKVLTLLK